jgi:hypothetical protein
MSNKEKLRVKQFIDKYNPLLSIKQIEQIWNSKNRQSIRYPCPNKITTFNKAISFGPYVHPDENNRHSLKGNKTTNCEVV